MTTIYPSFKKALGDGQDIDPSALEFRIETPDGTVTTITAPNAAITSTVTGTWKLSYECEQTGRYTWAALSTATNEETTVQGTFTVGDVIA